MSDSIDSAFPMEFTRLDPNSAFASLPLDEETENLLREYQKTVLRCAIQQLNAPDFDPKKHLGEHVDHVCKISRQVNASKRIAAMLEIAKIRAEATVKAAQIRAEATIKAAQLRARSGKLPGELDDPELENIAAPRGRDDAGRPYTDDEFHASLSRSVKEIYGVDWDAAVVAKTAKPGYVYPTPAECQAREAERPRRERQAEQNRKEADPSTAPTESSPREAPA